MTKQNTFDLHLHTHWSYDATTPPEHYFAQAEKSGITHIAITDHHTNDGIQETLEAAAKHPTVNFFSAAELTVHCELGTFDMVCLGLPITPTPELEKVYEAYHAWQRGFGDHLCKNFTEAGYPFPMEDRIRIVKQFRPEKTLKVQGITHVQYHLLLKYLLEEKKYFPDRDSLNKVWGSFPAYDYPEADFVLPAVRKAGGIIFIAHPHPYFYRDDLKRMDALRERLGFDGIECAHTDVPEELTPFYRDYCKKYNLLSSAGSDAHNPETPMATHIAERCYLEEILERVSCVKL